MFENVLWINYMENKIICQHYFRDCQKTLGREGGHKNGIRGCLRIDVLEQGFEI